MDIKGKRIVVTGGSGFLGSRIVEELKRNGASDIFVPRSSTHDLRDKGVCAEIVKGADIVIHAAAFVGGISANRERPGEFFYNNAMMGMNMVEESRKAGVKKFVNIGTVCSYPKNVPIPTPEEELWNGYPEETNGGYGLGKKVPLSQLIFYRIQYGFNGITPILVNLYGPGDHFDPAISHVIPALIKKFYEAKQNNSPSVTAWGDGSPTREFLYVDDAARGIVMAMMNYDKPDPINIGSGFEISIKDLTHTIANIIGYKGDIIWDTTKPNGQPRRKFDTTKAEREFGFKSTTTFDEGLRNTIKWYIDERENGRIA